MTTATCVLIFLGFFPLVHVLSFGSWPTQAPRPLDQSLASEFETEHFLSGFLFPCNSLGICNVFRGNSDHCFDFFSSYSSLGSPPVGPFPSEFEPAHFCLVSVLLSILLTICVVLKIYALFL